jgi:hypothetical protein
VGDGGELVGAVVCHDVAVLEVGSERGKRGWKLMIMKWSWPKLQGASSQQHLQLLTRY